MGYLTGISAKDQTIFRFRFTAKYTSSKLKDTNCRVHKDSDDSNDFNLLYMRECEKLRQQSN